MTLLSAFRKAYLGILAVPHVLMLLGYLLLTLDIPDCREFSIFLLPLFLGNLLSSVILAALILNAEDKLPFIFVSLTLQFVPSALLLLLNTFEMPEFVSWVIGVWLFIPIYVIGQLIILVLFLDRYLTPRPTD